MDRVDVKTAESSPEFQGYRTVPSFFVVEIKTHGSQDEPGLNLEEMTMSELQEFKRGEKKRVKNIIEEETKKRTNSEKE